MDRRAANLKSIQKVIAKSHQNISKISQKTRQSDGQTSLEKVLENDSELIDITKGGSISSASGCRIHPHILNILSYHKWCRV